MVSAGMLKIGYYYPAGSNQTGRNLFWVASFERETKKGGSLPLMNHPSLGGKWRFSMALPFSNGRICGVSRITNKGRNYS